MQALVVLLLLAGTAIADPDRAVLGPVAADATVSPAIVARVASALATAHPIDATCAADPACVARAGDAAHAKVAIAVVVRDTTVELAYVDVANRELIGRRTLAIADTNLRAIGKFADEAPVERAKELFAKGNEHYNLGEFAPALEQYKQAYRVKPLPAFLFNIAQCHRKLEQHAEAIAMYQSYLVGLPDAPNKPLVEDLIAESQKALVEQQATADRRATEAAKLEATRLAAAKKAAEDQRKAKEAEALTAQRRAEQARIEAETYDRHPARRWAVVAGGVGVGAAITGTVFALAARSRQNAFDNLGCGDRTHLLDEAALASCVTDRDRGRTDAMVANGFLFGGGAVLAAAAIVFALDPGNVERPRVVIAPSSVAVMVRW